MTQELKYFRIAGSLFMYPLQGQGDAHIVIYILPQIHQITLYRMVLILKRSIYRHDQVSQTSVALHSDAAGHMAFYRHRPVIGNFRLRLKGGIDYLGCLE